MGASAASEDNAAALGCDVGVASTAVGATCSSSQACILKRLDTIEAHLATIGQAVWLV